MFDRTLLIFAATCFFWGSAASAQSTSATAAGLAGNWEVPLPVHGTASIYPMKIEVKGDTFTGNISIWSVTEGKIDGDNISFSFKGKNDQLFATFTGKFYGDQISLVSTDARHKTNEPEMHSWTAYRNPNQRPLEWVPDDVQALPFASANVVKATSNENPGVPGRWEAPVSLDGKTYTYDFVFDPVNNGALTGKAALLSSEKESFQIGHGTLNGENLSFDWLKNGQRVAHFTGTLYGGQLALVMDSPNKQALTQGPGAKIHAMTAFRNDGDEPWYTWFPSPVDRGKMGSYSTLAREVHEFYTKGDMKTAATLAQVLNNVWDHGENDLLKSNRQLWGKIDHSMDLFILPIIRYHGGMPDPKDVEEKYQSYLKNLKLAN